MNPHPITVRGIALAEGRLLAIFAPLVARTREQLLVEAKAVAARQPDLLEWRADFYDRLGDPAEVAATAQALRSAQRRLEQRRGI